MTRDLFVSYARSDDLAVQPYVDALRERGVSIWIDEQGIDGATLWSAEIVDAIKQARVMLVMCSAASLRSPNVAREIFLAAEESKSILPIYLEDVKAPSSIRYHLAGIQCVEAFKHDFAKNIADVVRALHHLSETGDRALVVGTSTKETGNLPTPVNAKTGGILVQLLRKMGSLSSHLSREARFSLFFAISGIPAWFILLGVSTVGISLDYRVIWVLGFLFLLGILFNVLGILTAIIGLRAKEDSVSVLLMGLVLNVGEALAIGILLLMAYSYLRSHSFF